MFEEKIIEYKNGKIDLENISNEIVLLAFHRASEYEKAHKFECFSVKDCFPIFLKENCGAQIRKELKNLEQLKIQEQKEFLGDNGSCLDENQKSDKKFDPALMALESKLRLFGLFIYNLEEMVGFESNGQGSPVCKDGENGLIWMVANGSLFYLQPNEKFNAGSSYKPECLYDPKTDKKWCDQLFERDSIKTPNPRELK